MKSHLLLFICFSIIVSCTGEKEREIAERDQKIASLNADIEQLKTKNETEQRNHSEAILRLNSLSESVDKQYVSKNLLESFLDKTFQFVLNKESIVRYLLFEELRIKEVDLSSALWESSVTYKDERNLKEYPIVEKSDLLNYIWSNIDRSPESIKILISEKEKLFIYSLFEDNNLYNASGMESMVKGLLLAYEEFEYDESALEELHTLLYSDEDQYEEIYELAEERLPTSEMRDILSDDNYTSYESYSDITNRMAYVYKFWARRYHEGNMEVVYELIQEFHHNVSGNNEGEFDE